MPVSVLYVHRGEKIAGGNRVLLGLFEKLDRRRFQPLSLLPKAGPMEAELRARDVPYLVCDAIGPTMTGGKLAQLKTAWSLLRHLRRQRIALLHANTAAGYRLPSLAAWLLRVKRLCHLHLTPQPGSLERAFRIPPHAILTCSEALLAQNEELLARLCPAAVRRAVVNGVDTDGLRPGPPSARLVEELRLTPANRVVSIVGQVSERKGHPHFLEMARTVAAEFPEARFLVVGSDAQTGGAYQRQMEERARELGVAGVVSFLGFRTDVCDLVRASDVIVLPSRDEGLPMSLLEAAACGKPLVAYYLPGVAEVVRDGRNGFLTTPSVEALTEAVRKLLNDAPTRQQMGQAGRRLVEEKFSLGVQAEAVQQVYAELLNLN